MRSGLCVRPGRELAGKPQWPRLPCAGGGRDPRAEGGIIPHCAWVGGIWISQSIPNRPGAIRAIWRVIGTVLDPCGPKCQPKSSPTTPYSERARARTRARARSSTPHTAGAVASSSYYTRAVASSSYNRRRAQSSQQQHERFSSKCSPPRFSCHALTSLVTVQGRTVLQRRRSERVAGERQRRETSESAGGVRPCGWARAREKLAGR